MFLKHFCGFLLLFNLIKFGSSNDRVNFENSEPEYKNCLAELKDGEIKSGKCLPIVLCSSLSEAEEAKNECFLNDDPNESGICCPEDTVLTSKNDIIFVQNEGESSAAPPVQISTQDVQNAINKRFFSPPADEPSAASPGFDIGLRQDNPALFFPSSSVEDFPEEDEPMGDDPEDFHLRFNAPVEEAEDVDFIANEFVGTVETLKSENNLTDEEAGIGLRMFDISTNSDINRRCPWTPPPVCNRRDRFRTIDGTCNNFKKTNMGRAKTPYQRILLPEYSGSLQLPRRSKVNNFELPSARTLSLQLTRSDNDVDFEFTVLVMQMGQFIDHDLTHTPNHGIRCCDKGGKFPALFDAKKCFPIKIDENDPFWKGKKTCLSLARSLTSPGLDCELEFRQQMNQITHWLDGSNIYGSSKKESEELRENVGGRLKAASQRGTNKGSLPVCSTAPRSVGMCRGCRSCFFAGDIRVNEQHNLIVMHTVWTREHNRVAAFLEKLNPHWDDERLFQESRRIVIAEYQHIIHKEWLPSVLGKELMDTYGLWPLSKGHSLNYLDSFDTRITNEFSTAGFRFGHSLIPSKFNMDTSFGGRTTTNSMKLREIFFKPHEIKSASVIDGLVKGMTSQEGSLWDNSFVDDIKDHLFESRKGAGGLDLVAINIQRGRDHGIPGYNAYREVCLLKRATVFEDFKDFISEENVRKLKLLYNHVDDVDLFVGGFLESRHRDSVLGPVFKCIIGDQFARLKLGDRFFYDLAVDSNIAFDEPQLQEIRRASMARILCDNTDTVSFLQPRAFRQPSRRNVRTSCNSISIPTPNLSVFADKGRRN